MFMGCSKLEELPSMEILVSLEDLRANECRKQKGIRGQETKLKFIDVYGCSELEKLPSMEILVSLEELWANRCWKLKGIWGWAQGKNLRFLHVSTCFVVLEDLRSMETLVYLEDLQMVGCVNLKSIRGLAHETKI
jgi:hypothetical protein